MEPYRSGHNGAHSKCVSPHGLAGSNPAGSAQKDIAKPMSFFLAILSCLIHNINGNTNLNYLTIQQEAL